MDIKPAYVYIRLLIPLILGICAASVQPSLALKTASCVAVTLLIIFLLALQFGYKKLNLRRLPLLSGIAILLLNFWLGMFLFLQNSDAVSAQYFAKYKADSYQIKIISQPVYNQKYNRFSAKVIRVIHQNKSTNTCGNLMVQLYLDTVKPLKLVYGDVLLIRAPITDVPGPMNPAVFNYKKYLWSIGIDKQMVINQSGVVDLQQNIGNPIVKFAKSIQDKGVEKFGEIIKEPQLFAIASTLVFGYRSSLEAETLQNFSQTGTIHALSVSGMHVGIIYAFLLFLFQKLPKRKKYILLKVIVIILLVWLYALITGFSSSVSRSALMVTVTVLAQNYRKKTNAYNTLAFVAYVLLIFEPFYLFQIGFQLSFLAVLGIIFAYQPLYSFLITKNKYVNYIIQTIAVSCAAQIFTFPLSVYAFHIIPINFIISNLFISIPVLAIMIGGFFILIPGIDHLGFIYEYILKFLNDGLHFIAQLPFSFVSGVWIDRWQYFLLFIFFIFMSYSIIYKSKILFTTALCISFIFTILLQFQKFKMLHQRQFVLYALKKHYALALIQSNEMQLFTDLKKEDPLFKFQIQPSIDSLQIAHLYIDTLGASVQKKWMKSNASEISFGKYKILIVNKKQSLYQQKNKLIFDAVLFANNPKMDVELLQQNVSFENLIILGNNSFYKTEQYVNQSIKNKIKFHDYRKNTAFLKKIEL